MVRSVDVQLQAAIVRLARGNRDDSVVHPCSRIAGTVRDQRAVYRRRVSLQGQGQGAGLAVVALVSVREDQDTAARRRRFRSVGAPAAQAGRCGWHDCLPLVLSSARVGGLGRCVRSRPCRRPALSRGRHDTSRHKGTPSGGAPSDRTYAPGAQRAAFSCEVGHSRAELGTGGLSPSLVYRSPVEQAKDL